MANNQKLTRSNSALPFEFMLGRFSRSPVMSANGMCSSSQPLATQAGLDILRSGGSAADACIAMAAAMAVTEPCSTGIGGDAFALVFDPRKQENDRVSAFLGCGKSPKGLTLEVIDAKGISGDLLPEADALCVTIPGAPMMWNEVNDSFGNLSLAEVMAPAIRLAEEGFPVGPITSKVWENESAKLSQAGPGAKEHLLMENGTRAPKCGEIFKNPALARTLRLIGEKGAKEGFYRGPVADAIVAAVSDMGGVVELSDLEEHETLKMAPLKVEYNDITVWEIPPPTHGLAALLALGIANGIPRKDWTSDGFGSVSHIHTISECLRLGYADALNLVSDPEHLPVPPERMLMEDYLQKRRGDFDKVYCCAVDKNGIACSFINSNYCGFGTGIVPLGYGFSLQNRGHCFSLDPDHFNVAGPSKRPYHTIIPGLATRTKDQSLHSVFGVMGGFMQPQGHTQVLVNMMEFGMDPQEALCAPRFRLDNAGNSQSPADVKHPSLHVEPGFSPDVLDKLRNMGHRIREVDGWGRQFFGRGQIIYKCPDTGVLVGGSDGRADGCACGY